MSKSVVISLHYFNNNRNVQKEVLNGQKNGQKKSLLNSIVRFCTAFSRKLLYLDLLDKNQEIEILSRTNPENIHIRWTGKEDVFDKSQAYMMVSLPNATDSSAKGSR